MAEKKKELAQLTLDYDHLTNTYEDLRMTADYWQQRAHEQQIDSEKKVNELFEEHDKKVNELVEEHDKKVNDLAQEHDKKVNELVEEHNKKVNDLAQERDEKVNERDTIKEQFGNFAKAMSPVLRDLGGEVAVLQRRMQRTEHFCHNLANLIDNALQGAPPNGVLSDQAIQLLSTLTSPSVLVIVPANARPLDDADAAANDETHWIARCFLVYPHNNPDDAHDESLCFLVNKPY